MYNQRVLYTKEMARARARGDDISFTYPRNCPILNIFTKLIGEYAERITKNPSNLTQNLESQELSWSLLPQNTNPNYPPFSPRPPKERKHPNYDLSVVSISLGPHIHFFTSLYPQTYHAMTTSLIIDKYVHGQMISLSINI